MSSPSAPASIAPSSADAILHGCSSSLARIDLARGVWDAVVIGAGPAGAASAYLLAKRGWRVLLLERSRWPRDKVCGGCLSAGAVACIEHMGLSRLLQGATPIRSSVLHHARVHVRLPIERSFAIRRIEFDQGLVAAFEAAGGTFVAGASASVEDLCDAPSERVVRTSVGDESIAIGARIVLACDGLAGSSLSTEPWARWTIARDAYVGVAAAVCDTVEIEPYAIHMHIGAGGYVGAVSYAKGDVHLAAALDPQQVRVAGGASALVASILRSCGRELSKTQLKLKGVPALTRHRAELGGHRILAVGDACGYVEPFTGEGIAWALRSAIAVTSLLGSDWNDQTAIRWKAVHHAALSRKQNLCRAVRFAVRRPIVTRTALALLRHAPTLATWITRKTQVQT